MNTQIGLNIPGYFGVVHTFKKDKSDHSIIYTPKRAAFNEFFFEFDSFDNDEFDPLNFDSPFFISLEHKQILLKKLKESSSIETLRSLFFKRSRAFVYLTKGSVAFYSTEVDGLRVVFDDELNIFNGGPVTNTDIECLSEDAEMVCVYADDSLPYDVVPMDHRNVNVDGVLPRISSEHEFYLVCSDILNQGVPYTLLGKDQFTSDTITVDPSIKVFKMKHIYKGVPSSGV